MKREQIAFLRIRNYPTVVHSIHYHGSIYFGTTRMDLERVLTKKDAQEMNLEDSKRRDEEGCLDDELDWVWKEGYKTHQFMDINSLEKEAENVFFNEFIPKGALLVLEGESYIYEPMNVIASVPEYNATKDKLNSLITEIESLYDKEADNEFQDQIHELKKQWFTALYEA